MAALPDSYFEICILFHVTCIDVDIGIGIGIDIDIICNWFDTRWQQYSTHLHTNNTQNNTINLGRVQTVPRLCELYPGICLTTEEKARKKSVR
jgi:hypothetical protein